MRETGRPRKAKVVSADTFTSPLSNALVLKVGYKLRTGERIFQFFTFSYMPTLSVFMRTTRTRLRLGVYNASRAIGKDVKIKVHKKFYRHRVHYYAEVQP